MTSNTVPPRSSPPRRGPPLDLVLHSVQDELSTAATRACADGRPDDAERLAILACALTRAIDPSALAATWADDGEADIAGAHLARRLVTPGAEDGDLRPVSTAEGRALETAVARRLADTACCLAITGDKEDAAHALALWEGAATLTGLPAPHELRHDPTLSAGIPSGFKLPTPADLAAMVSARIDDWHRMKRDLVAAEELVQVIRAALAVPGAEDIVVHARKLKAEADEYKAVADLRLQVLQQTDERESMAREHLGAGDTECITIAAKRVADERDEARVALAGERDTNARRMALLLRADERDDAVREALGACLGETTIDAAKRCIQDCMAFLVHRRQSPGCARCSHQGA